MKIMVTGGTGFIGRNIVEKFKNQYDIVFPSKKEIDLIDQESVRKYFQNNKFDVVIHCATWDAKWNSNKDPSLVLDHNLRMFYHLARENNSFSRLICLGSGAEFGRPHCLPLVTEDHFQRFVPLDQYGFSKYIINSNIRLIENIVNLRLFGVFGPYEDWETRFISNVICQAMYDLPITIRQDALFDYLYINDFLKILAWSIENEPKSKDYNVCAGRAYLLSDLARIVLRVMNKDLPITILNKGLGAEYSGNNTRLCSEMQDLQFTPIEKAVEELVKWYQTNRDKISYEKIKENKRLFLASEENKNE